MYLGSRRTTSCLLLGNRTFLNTQRFMLVNGLAIFARERLVLPNEVSIATERQCQQNGGGSRDLQEMETTVQVGNSM